MNTFAKTLWCCSTHSHYVLNKKGLYFHLLSLFYVWKSCVPLQFSIKYWIYYGESQFLHEVTQNRIPSVWVLIIKLPLSFSSLTFQVLVITILYSDRLFNIHILHEIIQTLPFCLQFSIVVFQFHTFQCKW